MTVDSRRQESPEELEGDDGREAPDDVRDLAVVDRERPTSLPRPELSVAVVAGVRQGGERLHRPASLSA